MHRKIATQDECATALRRLSDAELTQLEKLARLRAIGLNALGWRELLHEAIVRLLDGSRRWPRHVPLVVVLRETMRSIASDHWRRLGRSVVVVESELDGDKVVDALDETWQPERQASAAETLARIESAFMGDDEALRVLAGMASGKTPSEIQNQLGINKKRYASTLRRIRRRLARKFPDRGGEA